MTPPTVANISNENSTLYLCGCCQHAVTWTTPAILCDVCATWYHTECHNIQSDEYVKLGHSSADWLCYLCDSDDDDRTNHTTTHHLSHSLPSLSSISSLDSDTEPRHTSSPTKPKPSWSKGKPLRIINVNCQSLSGKKGAWAHLLEGARPDIIIATETWLDNTITNNELEMPHHTVYRRDRSTGPGGGVLIAVASNIRSSLIKTATTSEILWVKLSCHGQRDLLIGAFYRPRVSDKTSIPELFATMDNLSSRRSYDIFLGGDFNLPGWEWKTLSLKPNCPYPQLHREFLELTNTHELKQLVEGPTRFCPSNTLDLMLTNVPLRVNKTTIIPGISDHDIPHVELSLKPHHIYQERREIPIYRRANWEGLKDHLISSTKYPQTIEDSPEELWNNLKQNINNASAKYIPTKLAKRKDSLPWINPYLDSLIVKRNNLRKRSKRYGKARTELRYKEHKRIVQREMRRQHRSYVHNMLTESEESSTATNKKFWTYVKHRRGDSTEITAIKTDHRLLTDKKSMADALNNQFQSVFSPADPAEPTDQKHQPTKTEMDDIRVHRDGVLKLLKDLKPNKASGPDNISARILKETADIVAGPLCHIFNQSLRLSTVPNDWRHANVTPIFKKGDKSKPENYRPISLTCIASKVLEHIVTSHIMKFMERNNILFPQQHGFRSKLSCETQLVELVCDISKELDAGQEVDACLLDFSKAFDKVNHAKLLSKMRKIGLCNQVVDWTAAFLRDRTQTVTLRGTSSNPCPVTSGVPQGSVIGPALFLIYINDLPNRVKSKVRLFADDTIIYTTANNSDQLMGDLKSLEAWEREWNMEFHPAKCEYIRFSRKKNKAPAPNYKLHDEVIPTAKTIKYLGVKIQDDLKWNSHIEYITTKASNTLGFIRRTIPPQSTTLRAKACKQLVRPVLEYASCSWDPLPKTLSSMVEAVQRRSARVVFNIPRISKASTTGMLEKLEWESLESRRQRRRVSLFRAMHYNEVNTNIQQYVSMTDCLTSARRHGLQYRQEHHNTKAHMSTFYVCTSKAWNQLDLKDRLLCAPG